MRLKFLLLLLCVSAPLAAQYPEHLYYKFNETSGNTAENAASPGLGLNPASFNGTPNWNTTDPQLGGAAVDNNGLNLSMTTGFSLSQLQDQDYTIDFWMRSTDADTFAIICADSVNTGIYLNNGQIVWWLGGSTPLFWSTPVNDGQWHHIACVYNARNNDDRARLYVDGVERDDSGNSLNFTYSTRNLEFFQWNGGLNYDGELDEFRLWNNDLSNGQINSRMNQEFNLEMEVRSPEGNLIADGGDYLIKQAALNTAATRTFTIQNTGTGTLSLTGPNPVSVSNDVSANATVTVQPGTSIPPGGSDTFTVQYNPDASGFSFDVNIANSGTAFSPTYTFTINGMADVGRPELLYYRFEEGSGNQTDNEADPGFGNDPAVFNAAPTWNTTDPILGNASVSVSGNDDINTGFFANTITGSAFTIEFWMRTTSNSGTQVMVGDGVGYAVYLNAGVLTVFSQGQFQAATATVNDGAWHHVAVVSDPANAGLIIYVDGAVDTTNLTFSFPFSSNETTLFSYGGTLDYIGEMDEFRWWCRVRTPTEIADDDNVELFPDADVQRPAATSIPDGGNDAVTGAIEGVASNVVYTVENTGGLDLNLGTVTVSGESNCSVVINALGSTVLAPGATTTFQLDVTPGAPGAFSFDFQLASDDPDEDPYNIAVSGNALPAAEIDVQRPAGAANSIPDGTGDVVGTTLVGIAASFTYTIENFGSGTLNIGAISSSSEVNCGVVITGPGSTSLAPSATTTFQVDVTAVAPGGFSFDLDVLSNDANESPYDIAVSGNAVNPPQIGVVSPVAYGSINVGLSSAPINHQIDNTGGAPLTITAISLGGTNPGDWGLGGLPSFPHVIPPAGNLVITGTFTPTATGARTALIQVVSDTGGVPSTNTDITINGTGTQGILSVTTPVAYGSSNIGVSTAPINHDIDNTGTGPARVTAISLVGANAGDWSLGSLPSFPDIITNGGTLTIDATFIPTAIGARTATIQIDWDQGGGVGATSTSIVLNGTGTQATLSVTSPVAYGSSNVGVSTAPINHDIDNTGSGNARVTAISLVGANSGDWSLGSLPSFPDVITNGGTLTIDATFTPTAVGARTATIQIDWDQGGGVSPVSTNIVLNGTGTQATLSVTSPVAYGLSNVGVSTAPINHDIDNTGTGPARITGISLVGANPGDWSLGSLPSFPDIITNGGTLTIDATFTPTAIGARTATIQISWDQGGGIGATITNIVLNGTGTGGSLSVTTPVAYGSSNVGVSTAPINHDIDNTGSGPARVTAINLVGANPGDWSLGSLPSFPDIITNGGTLTIDATFTPTATGARTATIQIDWDQGGGVGATSTNIVLNGTGTGGSLSVTTPVAYGSSNVGVSTAPINHDIDNTGSGAARITAISLGGANPGDWSLGSLPGSFPHTVVNGGTLTIDATFTPTAVGARNATIIIAWDQGGGVGPTNTVITLNGTGSLGAITATSPVGYGSSNVGVSTAALPHQLDNSGSGPARITAISLVGANAGDWALSGVPGLPQTIPSASNLTIFATFTPTAIGARTATIQIDWDQGGGVGATSTSIVLNGTGTQATLSVTTPVAYGSANVGVSTAPINHDIDNTGTGPARVTAISLVGANPSDWSLGSLPSFPDIITNGGTLTIDATFTPTAIGARTATIQIDWDQGGGVSPTSTNIVLNGTGTGGSLSVTTPVAYGSSNVGVSTAPINHDIDNTGSGPARVTGISLVGTNAGDWSLGSLPGSFPHTIANGGTLTIDATFTPTTVGARTATIQIDWDQGGGVGATSTNIVLNGTGTQATLSVTTPVGYGSTNVGVSTAPINHDIDNTGTGPARVTAISLVGANPSDWSLGSLPSFPDIITNGGTLTIDATFTPTANGARTATIQIDWDQGSGVSPTSTNIVLNGTGSQGILSVTTPVAFGSSNVGVSTAPINHDIDNTGTGPARVTAISLVGANPGDWSLGSLPSFPDIITNGGTLTIDATFTPTAVGARTATIQIDWDQGGGVSPTSTNIVLTGTGTQATLSVTTPVAYGSSNVGVSTAPINHDIDNTGTGPARITGISLVGANAGDWSLGSLPGFPASITNGGTLTIDATFTPTAVGARTATIQISWDQGGGIGATVTNIVLNGTGTGGALSVTTPVAYGSSNVGVSTAPINHDIDNTGTGPARVTSISLVGANPGDWSLGSLPGFPDIITNGGTLTIDATFTPTAVGARTATIQIDWDQGGGVGATSTSIVLNGNGTQAVLSVTTPVAYGSSNVGVSTAPINHDIDNTGTGPARITGISLVGANPGDWSLGSLPSFPDIITNGGTLTIDATFTPTAVGARTATIQIDWDQGGGIGATVTNIVLNGTGTGGALSVTTPVAYGSSNIGVSTAPINHDIDNTGTGPARVTAISLVGANAGDWSLGSLPSFPDIITNGGTLTIDATFTPTAIGARTATIQIDWDQGGGVGATATNIVLNGTGTQGILSVTTPVAYGSSNVGVSTAPINHDIDNTGTGPARITGISLVGANASDWSLGSLPGSFPHIITNGGTLTIDATFTPTAISARTATIQIDWDQGAGVSPTSTNIVLNGTGTGGSLSVTTPVAYGSSNVGVSTAPINHDIDNTGSGPARVTGISLVGTNAGDWSLGSLPGSFPHTIANGGTLTIDATFTPTTVGARTATIQIDWDQGGGVGATSTNIVLNGTGTQATLSVTTPVGYGSTNVGVSTAPINHDIDNTGTGPARITGISLVGANPGDWSLGSLPSFPDIITNGGTLTIDATFTPTAVGARTATIQIDWDQGGGVSPTSTNIVLNGTGTQATLSSTSPINYGSSNIGVSAPPIIHDIDNLGSGDATITGITLTGVNAGDWGLSGLPAFPHTLTGSSTLQITGTFTPTATGIRDATIEIAWNQGSGIGATVTNIDLDGTGTSAVLSVLSPVDYGTVNVGVPSAPVTHDIDNTGSGTANITSITLGGPNAGDWGLSGLPPFPFSLGNGFTLSIDGVLTPSAPGARNATIDIAWDQGGGVGATVTTINISGTGTGGTVSATTPVDYGAVALGSSSGFVPHQINNTGSGSARITAISLSGANAGDWALVLPSFPQTIPSGSNLTIFGNFSPSAIGIRNATINITWDNGAPPSNFFDINITGTGGGATSISGLTIGPDDGGPVAVSAFVVGPAGGFVDVAVTYSGGANPGAAVLSEHASLTIVGNVIQNVPANTSITFSWDAYATERHTTAANYAVTLSPSNFTIPGTPSTSSTFTLDRDGGWAKHSTPFGLSDGVYGHTSVYDTINDRLIVFGGRREGVISSEVWTFDYTVSGQGWRQISPAGTLPTARYYHTAVYDAPRGRMVVFGGSTGAAQLGDTWELDLTYGAETWTQIVTAPTPAVRRNATLVQDSANERAVLYGGFNGSTVYADTWSFDLTTDSWGAGAVVTVGAPTGRWGHAAIWDSTGDRMVVYAGQRSTGTSDEVWELSLSGTPTWTQIAVSGTPGKRIFTAYEYDPAGDRLIVQGGYLGGTKKEDTWELPFSGGMANTWSLLPQDPEAAQGRVVGTMTLDASRNQILVFGGIRHPNVLITKISVLSISGAPVWLPSPDTPIDGAGPEGRWGASMVYDATNDRVVLWGGKDQTDYYDDVWVLDQSVPDADWQRLTVSGPNPGARVYQATAYDAAGNRMFIHGGSLASGTYVDDLWALDLNTATWSQLSASGTGTRIWHAMDYDAPNNRLLMFGGQNASFLGDAWEFDIGTSIWSPVAVTGITARYGHGVVYDSINQRMVFFAGRDSAGYRNDVWALDTNTLTWSDITPGAGSAPSTRTLFAYTGNSAGSRAWMHGGNRGPELDDLWELDLSGVTASWSLIAPAGDSPQARQTHVACLDTSGNLFVGFGLHDTRASSDLWQIDTNNTAAGWELAWLPSSPTSMSHSNVALDAANNRLIAFGGIASGVHDPIVWQLDLSSPVATWTPLMVSGTPPTPRRSASFVYDSNAVPPRMVMYGGRTEAGSSSVTDELWALELSLGSEQWIQLAPTVIDDPGRRTQHTAIIDGSNRMIVFGGTNHVGSKLNNVFALDLVTLTWTEVLPSGTAPAVRFAHTSVYDATSNRMIVFGGAGSTGSALGDAHVLDLGTNAWSPLAAAGTAPTARFYHSAVVDPVNQRMLVFGGFGTSAFGELFSLDLTTDTWSTIPGTIAQPQERWGHGAVWDDSEARMAIVGGFLDGQVAATEGGGVRADTWFWGD